jgi:hypothetical protein
LPSPRTRRREARLGDPGAGRPPISAWLLLDGKPRHHVIDVPGDRADQCAEDHARVDTPASTMPVPIVCARAGRRPGRR